MGGGDVAKYAAGPDRGELLVVTDEPDDGAAVDGVRDDAVEGEGVGHAGFVDHHERAWTDGAHERGAGGVDEVVVEFGECLARHCGRFRLRGGRHG